MTDVSPPKAIPDGFITAKEAEKRYGLSGSYLIRKHKEGAFAGDQIGPIWLFHVDSLDAWVKARKRRGGYQPRKPKAEAAGDE